MSAKNHFSRFIRLCFAATLLFALGCAEKNTIENNDNDGANPLPSDPEGIIAAFCKNLKKCDGFAGDYKTEEECQAANMNEFNDLTKKCGIAAFDIKGLFMDYIACFAKADCEAVKNRGAGSKTCSKEASDYGVAVNNKCLQDGGGGEDDDASTPDSGKDAGEKDVGGDDDDSSTDGGEGNPVMLACEYLRICKAYEGYGMADYDDCMDKWIKVYADFGHKCGSSAGELAALMDDVLICISTNPCELISTEAKYRATCREEVEMLDLLYGERCKEKE